MKAELGENIVSMMTTEKRLQWLWDVLNGCQFLGSESEIVTEVRRDLKEALGSVQFSQEDLGSSRRTMEEVTQAYNEGRGDNLPEAGSFNAHEVMGILRAKSTGSGGF